MAEPKASDIIVVIYSAYNPNEQTDDYWLMEPVFISGQSMTDIEVFNHVSKLEKGCSLEIHQILR